MSRLLDPLRVCLWLTLGTGCTSSTGNVLSWAEATATDRGGAAGGSGTAGESGAGGAASAGTSAGLAGAGGSVLPDACAGAFYCEDFEGSLGMVGITGGGQVELSSVAHSGTGALKASIESANDWARVEVPLFGKQTLFVRAWVRVEESIPASVRQALLVLHTSDDANRGIGRDKVSLDWLGPAAFDLSNTRDVAMLPMASGATQVGQWHCAQVAIASPPEQARASFSLDGELITASEPGIVPPGGFGWLMFGVEYALVPGPLTVYFDDIVVSDDERACP